MYTSHSILNKKEAIVNVFFVDNYDVKMLYYVIKRDEFTGGYYESYQARKNTGLY